jgi:hypothetical protein
MKKEQLVFLLSAFLLFGCGPSPTPQVIVVTATNEPTKAATSTSAVTKTFTPEPTNTPTPTRTRKPTNTPTQTVEPRQATQTTVAKSQEATRVYKQNIDDIRQECPPIDWVELSEVAYAKEHEGECVYIRVVISNINFEEQLLDTWIGYYSANMVVGFGRLNNQTGRLTDDMWLNVYGTVSTTSWVWINNMTGKETPITGVQARLIEGPNGLIWVHE